MDDANLIRKASLFSTKCNAVGKSFDPSAFRTSTDVRRRKPLHAPRTTCLHYGLPEAFNALAGFPEAEQEEGLPNLLPLSSVAFTECSLMRLAS